MSIPRVSVVIPVRDDPPIFRCVASVLAAVEAFGEAEVIVIDNASAAPFRASLEALGPRVRVLDEPVEGAAAARNRGIEAASGGIVFFTDADCVVDPAWISEGLRGFEVTGAEILRGHAGGLLETRSARLIGAQFRGREPARAGAPTRCDGRNLAVRREVLERVRFNPTLLRAEDLEFGAMAAAAGFRVASWPAMRVQHEHEARAAEFIARRASSGWYLREAELQHPGLRIAGRPGRATRLVGRALRGRPGARVLPRVIIAAATRAGAAIEAASWLPPRFGGRLLRFAALAASAAGAFSRDAGLPPPRRPLSPPPGR